MILLAEEDTASPKNQSKVQWLDIVEYSNEVLAFKDAAINCLGLKRVTRRFNESSDIGSIGLGLYVVYKLRNSFAQPPVGAQSLPDSCL